VVAAYAPIGPEPGGPDLPESLRTVLLTPPAVPLPARPAVRPAVLLPVLLPDGDLDWVLYEGPSSLRRGPRGLLEPAGPRLGVAAIAEASFVVVPALAVDRRGVRMGRGGGSYDRALARASDSAFTVALLHDGELVDTVPAEPHDRRVRATITPAEGLSETPDWTK
jgi:5-formyltetrahydrofolate cyclo-ligase